MSAKFKVSRRAFLRTAGLGTGAVVFSSYLAPSLQAQGLIRNLIDGFPVKDVPVVALKVNGDVVIIAHRPEMGQGIRSSLAAVFADELEADWKRVTLKQADADAKKFAVIFPAEVAADLPLPFPYDELQKKGTPQYLIAPEGSQFTDSSRSMTAYYQVMRLFGAGIRLTLTRVAAKKWGVAEKDCRAEKHRIYGPNGQSTDYRWLLLGAMKETPPTYEEINAALKKPGDFRYIGKGKEPMPFYDALDMVRGTTVYGADVDVPGMLTAMIERCPVANGALVSYDAAPALAVPGVRAVLPVYPPGVRGGGVGGAFHPHAGVAVVATNTWAALRGRRALRPTIRWDLGPHATYDSDAFRKELEASAAKPGRVVRRLKDVDDAFAQAGGGTMEAQYYVPHLAQTPMEPPVAVALFKNGRMEVWAPTQNPDGAQQIAGQLVLGLTDKQMTEEEFKEKARGAATVHVTFLGGGFGRKSKPDYVEEAAILAKQMPGVPIRVQWTREDDVKFSYYNAASSQYLKASLGADKRPTALLQRSALTSFFGTLVPNYSTPGLNDPGERAFWAKYRRDLFGGGEYPYASGIERAQGLEDMPFDVPNIRLENCPAENHIRVGWMRSVANVYHSFAINSFAGELAIAAGRDQKDYLLDLIGSARILDEKIMSSQAIERYRNNELPLAAIEIPLVKGGKVNQVVSGFPPDTSRLHAVINQVAAESDWKNKVAQYKGTRRGLGIAAHRSFLSYVAVVADVSLSDQNELTINDIYATIHCGLAVNRDRVLAQMEGGVVYGLSMALLNEITVKNGAVVQNNFDDYPVLRLYQTPRIHVSIVDSEDPPTGVGEPPTPAVAPALANAIAAAGGPRIREMPLAKSSVDEAKKANKVVFV